MDSIFAAALSYRNVLARHFMMLFSTILLLVQPQGSLEILQLHPSAPTTGVCLTTCVLFFLASFFSFSRVVEWSIILCHMIYVYSAVSLLEMSSIRSFDLFVPLTWYKFCTVLNLCS